MYREQFDQNYHIFHCPHLIDALFHQDLHCILHTVFFLINLLLNKFILIIIR